jgi:predicted ATPase
MRPQDYPPPTVLILTGPPGAGKTTAAGILAGRAERAVHVESDRLFDFIRSGFVEPWRRRGDRPPRLLLRAAAERASRVRVRRRVWHDFADLGPLSRHAVDITTEGPEAAADLIAARLRDGSLRA